MNFITENTKEDNPSETRGQEKNDVRDSDFYNTQEGFGRIRKSTEPEQENDYSQQVIQMMNTRNPI